MYQYQSLNCVSPIFFDYQNSINDDFWNYSAKYLTSMIFHIILSSILPRIIYDLLKCRFLFLEITPLMKIFHWILRKIKWNMGPSDYISFVCFENWINIFILLTDFNNIVFTITTFSDVQRYHLSPLYWK